MQHIKYFALSLTPKKRLSVSAWSDSNRYLSSKASSEPGRWKTSRAPHTKEIMDVLSESHPCQRVILKFSAQSSKTEIGLNWIGYTIDHAPAPMLVVVPTIEVRSRWVKQRLSPMIKESPVLKEIIDVKKSRDSSNAEDIKDFPGGILVLGGANSAASLASMPIKKVLCDEVDRFPWEVGQEGDPLGLIDERTKTFPRRKVCLVSTPTVKGASRIESEYLDSSRGKWQVPCPHCHEYQTLVWKNVKWDNDPLDIEGKPLRVWYDCEHCGAEIDEKDKSRILKFGKWKHEFPNHPHLGYEFNSISSMPGLGFTWSELVIKWKAALKDVSKLKRFVNTALAEVWEDKSNEVGLIDLSTLTSQRQQREIPEGCVALTAGVDTQDNYLELTLLGWGKNKLPIIESIQIQGVTTKRAVWDELENYLNTGFINKFGYKIMISGVGVDVRGHRGKEVRDFVSRRTLKVPVFAVQGATTRLGRAISTNPSYQDKDLSGKILKNSVALWNVGTEYCKDFIYGTLNNDSKEPELDRVFSFPIGLDDNYFLGLNSEYFDTEKNKYVKRKGTNYARNEPLDTLVYAWAIGHHKGVRIGMNNFGLPDPAYWERKFKLLEQYPVDKVELNQVQVVQPEIQIAEKGKISLSNWGRK